MEDREEQGRTGCEREDTATYQESRMMEMSTWQKTTIKMEKQEI